MTEFEGSIESAHSILSALLERARKLGLAGSVEFSIPASEIGQTDEKYDGVYLTVKINTNWDYEKVNPEYKESQGDESDGESSDTDKAH